jgi:chromate transporter
MDQETPAKGLDTDTLFREVVPVRWLGLAFDAPILTSMNVTVTLLAAAAALAIFRFKAGMMPALASCCVASIARHVSGLT